MHIFAGIAHHSDFLSLRRRISLRLSLFLAAEKVHMIITSNAYCTAWSPILDYLVACVMRPSQKRQQMRNTRLLPNHIPIPIIRLRQHACLQSTTIHRNAYTTVSNSRTQPCNPRPKLPPNLAVHHETPPKSSISVRSGMANKLLQRPITSSAMA